MYIYIIFFFCFHWLLFLAAHGKWGTKITKDIGVERPMPTLTAFSSPLGTFARPVVPTSLDRHALLSSNQVMFQVRGADKGNG